MENVPAQRVEEWVVGTIAAACSVEPEKLTLGTRLADVGMYSLRLYALMARIEVDFECELTQSHIVDLMTASSIREVVILLERIATMSSEET